MKNLSLNQVKISVTNINRSFNFYKRLGLIPIVKSDHYARFIVPGNEATFSLHVSENVNSTTTVYFEVEDIDSFYKEANSNGFEFEHAPVDQRWQWREAYLRDPDGNIICFYHAGEIRMNPEWRLPESKDRHLITKDSFKKWLEEYKAAWENALPENAAMLFADDAQYFETPYDPPSVGSQKIIEYWNVVPESQKDVHFAYEIIHTFANVGYCKWNASFFRTTSKKNVLLNGIFEVHFDSAGKAKIFREWWHRKES